MSSLSYCCIGLCTRRHFIQHFVFPFCSFSSGSLVIIKDKSISTFLLYFSLECVANLFQERSIHSCLSLTFLLPVRLILKEVVHIFLFSFFFFNKMFKKNARRIFSLCLPGCSWCLYETSACMHTTHI